VTNSDVWQQLKYIHVYTSSQVTKVQSIIMSVLK